MLNKNVKAKKSKNKYVKTENEISMNNNNKLKN